MGFLKFNIKESEPDKAMYIKINSILAYTITTDAITIYIGNQIITVDASIDWMRDDFWADLSKIGTPFLKLAGTKTNNLWINEKEVKMLSNLGSATRTTVLFGADNLFKLDVEGEGTVIAGLLAKEADFAKFADYEDPNKVTVSDTYLIKRLEFNVDKANI